METPGCSPVSSVIPPRPPPSQTAVKPCYSGSLSSMSPSQAFLQPGTTPPHSQPGEEKVFKVSNIVPKNASNLIVCLISILGGT